MELSQKDTQAAKGIAIIGMVALHLFCRLGALPYEPLIWIGDIPLVYYWGLMGDLCVPVFCFCSGYAHYLLHDRQGARYCRRIPEKILRFLSNYWIVLILFSIIGLFCDASGKIPGSFETFLGNLLLYRMTYNGAWWFVTTYLLLLLLSPLAVPLAGRMNTSLMLFMSSCVYVISYVFRVQYILDIPNPVIAWLWNQLILLGTSQFGYTIGMCSYKHGWIGKMRKFVRDNPYSRCWKLMIVVVLPGAAFVAHCVVQSMFVAPAVAGAVLTALYACDRPVWLDRILVFLGKQSTNIWLCHMFFYLTLFEGFVFAAKFPIAILLTMFAVCILVSYLVRAIQGLCERFCCVCKNV